MSRWHLLLLTEVTMLTLELRLERTMQTMLELLNLLGLELELGDRATLLGEARLRILRKQLVLWLRLRLRLRLLSLLRMLLRRTLLRRTLLRRTLLRQALLRQALRRRTLRGRRDLLSLLRTVLGDAGLELLEGASLGDTQRAALRLATAQFPGPHVGILSHLDNLRSQQG